MKKKRKVIRWCDPVTITMIAGPGAVTGDTLRALMKRRSMRRINRLLRRKTK